MPIPCPSSGELRALPTVAPEGRPLGRDRELVALVQNARIGDPDAWTRLVHRFDGMLRHIARSYRLSPADVDDVVQMTWLDVVNAIEQIREPMAISGWMATVTRRHALKRIQAHVREHLTDDPQLGERPHDHSPEAAFPSPEAATLSLERRAVLAAAIAKLPHRQRVLMTVLLTQPTLEYREIAEMLSIPIGSIGPTRARCLARLACDTQLRAQRLHA